MLVWNILENAMSQEKGVTGTQSIKEDKRPFVCLFVLYDYSPGEFKRVW